MQFRKDGRQTKSQARIAPGTTQIRAAPPKGHTDFRNMKRAVGPHLLKREHGPSCTCGSSFVTYDALVSHHVYPPSIAQRAVRLYETRMPALRGEYLLSSLNPSFDSRFCTPVAPLRTARSWERGGCRAAYFRPLLSALEGGGGAEGRW